MDELTTPTAEAQALPPDKNRDFYRPLTLFLFFLLGILMMYSYRYPLLRTWDSWGSEHGYNANGLYIFLGSCALVFMLRKRLRAVPKAINYLGLAGVVAALLWSLAFKRGDINAMQTIGFVGLIWCIALYVGGWLVARALMFPLGLSLFAVQWGLGSSVVSLQMRIISTRIACWFVNITGAPFGVGVLRQGTNVSSANVPELAFDVAAPCSGLQSLVMTSVLSLLMCYLMLRTWWKRVVMILLIAPIAILNNSLRIVLIAYSGTFFTWIEHTFGLDPGWGRTVAFGAFHEYPGIFVYTMGFVMVWLAAHYLERLPGVERDAWLERKAAKAAQREHKRAQAADAEPGEPEPAVSSEPAEATPAAPEHTPDYAYYGRAWKHVLAVLVLVFVAHVLGLHAKQNIRPTVGLAQQRLPVLVSGKDGYGFRMLPYITAFPEQIAGRVMISLPVTELELEELPDDTEYFRGLYVATNAYQAYMLATQLLLHGQAESNAPGTAVETAVQEILSPLGFESNAIERVTWLGNQMRATVTNAPDLQQVRFAYKLMLANLAQLDPGPDKIMMAVVQNNTDRHSIHAPEACFPSQGWTIDDPVPIAMLLGGTTVEVARMDVGFKQQNIRECVIYWYQCEGEGDQKVYATRNYPWLPFKTALDLVLKGRSDRWAFVRFSKGVLEGGTHDDAFAELNEFVTTMEPYLVYER
jgi:exosortase